MKPVRKSPAPRRSRWRSAVQKNSYPRHLPDARAGESPLNLTAVLAKARTFFGVSAPTGSELRPFLEAVASLTPADAIALASLLVAGWAYLFPRSPKEKRNCSYVSKISGRVCGARILVTEFDSAEKRLRLVCERAHVVWYPPRSRP